MFSSEMETSPSRQPRRKAAKGITKFLNLFQHTQVTESQAAAAQYGSGPRPGKPGPVLSIQLDVDARQRVLGLIVVTPRVIERFDLNGTLVNEALLPHSLSCVSYGIIVGIGKVVMCGSQEGHVFLVKVNTLEIVLLKKDEGGGNRGTLVSYDPKTFEVTPEKCGSSGVSICAICARYSFGDFVQYLIVGTSEGQVQIWEVPSARLLQSINFSVIFSASEMNIDSSPSSLSSTSPVAKNYSLDLDGASESTKTMYIGDIVAFSRLNQTWVGYGDGTLAVIDILKGDVVKKTKISNLPIHSLRIGYSLDVVIALSGNTFITFWNPVHFSCLLNVSLPSPICDVPLNHISVSDSTGSSLVLILCGVEGSLYLVSIERDQTAGLKYTLLEKNREDRRQLPITACSVNTQVMAILTGDASGVVQATTNLMFFKRYSASHRRMLDLH